MNSGEENIALWKTNCKDFSENLKGMEFTDIEARADYCLSRDLSQFLIPESLTSHIPKYQSNLRKSFSENLQTLLILYRKEGIEFNIRRDGSYANFQQVPTRGDIHTHDYIELFYVISGTFSQALLGETYTFEAGDVVITDKNCEHADILGATDTSVLFLCINFFYMEKLLKYNQGQSELQRFLFHAISKKKREQSFLVFRPAEASFQRNPLYSPKKISVKSILEQLVQEEYTQSPGFEAIMEGLMIRLLFRLGQDYSMMRYTDETASREQLLLFELEKYIRTHPAEVTTTLLENQFHYHRNYYNHLLKKYRDKSMCEYIQDIRIKKACDLLQSTNLTVKEIAHQVGYENTNFFYSLFERHVGKKPREYRFFSSIQPIQ